jgi:hypothetical protein
MTKFRVTLEWNAVPYADFMYIARGQIKGVPHIFHAHKLSILCNRICEEICEAR